MQLLFNRSCAVKGSKTEGVAESGICHCATARIFVFNNDEGEKKPPILLMPNSNIESFGRMVLDKY